MDLSSKCLSGLPWNLYRHFAAVTCFGKELPRYMTWCTKNSIFFVLMQGSRNTLCRKTVSVFFSLLPFFPVVKAKGEFSAAQPKDLPQKIRSPSALISFPSDTNRDICFYPIYYTSSCLSNHIASYLSNPLCPQGLPLFCLWDLMLPSFKKFSFMQLSYGKHSVISVQ